MLLIDFSAFLKGKEQNSTLVSLQSKCMFSLEVANVMVSNGVVNF